MALKKRLPDETESGMCALEWLKVPAEMNFDVARVARFENDANGNGGDRDDDPGYGGVPAVAGTDN